MRIAVIAWSMGHNAMSRGWYLADTLRGRHEVALRGPLLTRRGDDIWPPVRASDRVPMQAFAAHDLACYLDEAERFAASIEADLVYVSKPRFPGALLGELISRRCGVPLVLDIDDDEETFARADDWMTRAAPELVEEADALTVASEPLRRRHGGTLVGQARDERLFDPSRYDRTAARAELGYGPDDTVILFLGTPRRHKGVLEVAQALEELGDPRLRLCVIGSISDPRFEEQLASFDPRSVQLIASRPIGEVPRLMTVGDLVCLQQDTGSPAATHQVPMKLTEALAMRVPVLASETPALAPFIERELIWPVGGEPLAQRIGALVANRAAMAQRADRAREYFLAHLSYQTTGAILEGVLAAAAGPRSRPRWTAVLSAARAQPGCPRGGPHVHAADERDATAELVLELGEEALGALAVAVDGASRCVLAGYPNHGNPGDHAIWLGAKQMLRKLGVEVVYECDWKTYSRAAVARAVEQGAMIILTGGGNFGDLWPNTQGLRERVLADFPGVRMLQLPQSIQFEHDENRERVRALLAQHGNVELMVRDGDSLDRARRWFEVPVTLVPDLAFGVWLPPIGDPTVVDIVWIARGDKESRGFEPPPGARGVERCDWMPLPADSDPGLAGPRLSPSMDALLARNKAMTRAATRGEEFDDKLLSRVWAKLSRERLALACSVLRRGRVVVSDRLHVHVLALRMGVPTVVGDNSYGKVRGLYETYTSRAPTARWARTPDDALATAQQWL
jgi:exopolysaccharide biosynthesis predicted pyruvyltransferase EpsI/glycosyltransferase involved in cell wall biosynthesis